MAGGSDFRVQESVAPDPGADRMVPMTTLPSRSRMVRAYQERDGSFEGVFVLAVKTTGIYCKPTCPARKPLPRNVDFYGTPAEAEAKGFRPCLRCEPRRDPGAPPEWVTDALALLEASPGGRLTDDELTRAGSSPSRLRRYFRETHGMTFQAWQRARRLGLASQDLHRGAAAGDAAEAGGFDSESGFRDAFAKLFGNPPKRHASVGRPPIHARILPSPIGPLLACADDRGLSFLEFTDRKGLPGQARALQRHLGTPVTPGNHPILDQIEMELTRYFAGEPIEFETPFLAPGTPFQESVWDALRTIPRGETWSYDQLARTLGRPGSARAVGRANGMNRLAIIIPCHRVVRADGTLCGYGGGLWRKKRLLELEQNPP